MTADFQQYYGIALPLEDGVPDLARMAVLWEQLPAGSRTARAQSPTLQWGTAEYLLWQIEYQVRALGWALSYDKKHPTPKPKPIQTPAQLADAHRRQESALALKERMELEVFG